MVAPRDMASRAPSPPRIVASATLAELFRRQGHPEMAERILSGLDPQEPGSALRTAGPRPGEARVRRLRVLLARVQSRRRAEGGTGR
ncbi:MAG: hypothetical protein FJ098_10545 [Deltaproteobacteria bacterium]|nr:hypothetical protein [Deltaproteobacteria bacterium]